MSLPMYDDLHLTGTEIWPTTWAGRWRAHPDHYDRLTFSEFIVSSYYTRQSVASFIVDP